VKCEEVNDLLSAFQDRELSVEEMTAIEGHLKDCAACAAKSNVMVGLSRIVRHWEGVRSSDNARRRLLEKASTAAPESGRAVGPVALWILGLIAAALLGGGAVALAYWYFGREDRSAADAGPRRAPVAVCVAVEGRVELVQPGGARLDLRGRRDLEASQEVFCDGGSAAQLELPGGLSPTVLVLRGSGSMVFGPAGPVLKGGRLVFHVPASPGDKTVSIAVGSWRVETGRAGAVGLVELGRDESVRLAVLQGSARLTGVAASEAGRAAGGGLGVSAGKEVSVVTDAGGTRVRPPCDISDRNAFGLLSGAAEDKDKVRPPAVEAQPAH